MNYSNYKLWIDILPEFLGSKKSHLGITIGELENPTKINEISPPPEDKEIDIPISSETPESAEQKGPTEFDLLSDIKKIISNPIGILFLSLVGIFGYIYFASYVLYQLISLLYPIYCMYTILHSGSNGEPLESGGTIHLMKYFIIYGHLETITYIFGLSLLYHFKILIVCVLIYLMGYQPDWLNSLYQKIIFYDTVTWNLLNAIIQRIREEAVKIKKIEKNNS